MAEIWNDKFIKEKAYSVDNDRFKEKCYVFAPFPEANQHGFQDGDIRSILYADMYARFQRMENYNVLFPTGFNSITLESFIESKKMFKILDDQSTDVYYKQMSKLGVGIFDGKCINMRHSEYLSILQNAFIEFYERNYIKYKIASPYYVKETNKIYDAMEAPMGSVKSAMRCFVLDIDGLIPDIVRDIQALPILEEYKEELISDLGPISVLRFSMYLSNGEELELEMENPEYMAGITYIFLNPDLMNVRPYISEDEVDSVSQFLENKASLYAFSGLTAKNPLTGSDIPVFISTLYPKDIYLGIPGVDVEDEALAENEGFDYISIVSEGILMNSDILDGYTIEEGREKIIESFSGASIGRVSFKYRTKEILMSSLDPFGALLPFLEEKANLNSLKNFLPYSFSPQFRPVLGEDVSVSGVPITGTIHHYFVEGVLPLLSIIYDDIGSIESLFSDETKNVLESWLPIEEAYIPANLLKEYLLLPIIFYSIIKKEVSYALPSLFKNVTIVKKTYDIYHKSIKRSNNNLLNMDSWIDKYGPDSIRDMCLRSNPNEELIFDPYQLEDTKVAMDKIKQALLSYSDGDVLSLDYHFHRFTAYMEDALKNRNMNRFFWVLNEFNEKVLFKERISKSQLLTYIRIIYVVYPCLAEDIYQKVFHGRYSIVNEGWPSN